MFKKIAEIASEWTGLDLNELEHVQDLALPTSQVARTSFEYALDDNFDQENPESAIPKLLDLLHDATPEEADHIHSMLKILGYPGRNSKTASIDKYQEYYEMASEYEPPDVVLGGISLWSFPPDASVVKAVASDSGEVYFWPAYITENTEDGNYENEPHHGDVNGNIMLQGQTPTLMAYIYGDEFEGWDDDSEEYSGNMEDFYELVSEKSFSKTAAIRRSTVMRIHNELKKSEGFVPEFEIDDTPFPGPNKFILDIDLSVFWVPVDFDGNIHEDGYPFHSHVQSALMDKLSDDTMVSGYFANGPKSMMGIPAYTAQLWCVNYDEIPDFYYDRVMQTFGEAKLINWNYQTLKDEREPEDPTLNNQFYDGDKLVLTQDIEEHPAGDTAEFVSRRPGGQTAWIQTSDGFMIDAPFEAFEKIAATIRDNGTVGFEGDDLGNNHKFILTPDGEFYAWGKKEYDYGKGMLAIENEGQIWDELDDFTKYEWERDSSDTYNFYRNQGYATGTTSSGGFFMVNAPSGLNEEQIQALEDLFRQQGYKSIVIHESGTRNFFNRAKDALDWLSPRRNPEPEEKEYPKFFEGRPEKDLWKEADVAKRDYKNLVEDKKFGIYFDESYVWDADNDFHHNDYLDSIDEELENDPNPDEPENLLFGTIYTDGSVNVYGNGSVSPYNVQQIKKILPNIHKIYWNDSYWVDI